MLRTIELLVVFRTGIIYTLYTGALYMYYLNKSKSSRYYMTHYDRGIVKMLCNAHTHIYTHLVSSKALIYIYNILLQILLHNIRY